MSQSSVKRFANHQRVSTFLPAQCCGFHGRHPAHADDALTPLGRRFLAAAAAVPAAADLVNRELSASAQHYRDRERCRLQQRLRDDGRWKWETTACSKVPV